jgi:hypothetical protein
MPSLGRRSRVVRTRKCFATRAKPCGPIVPKPGATPSVDWHEASDEVTGGPEALTV